MIERSRVHRPPVTDPEAFEAAVEPVAGRVYTRPARGTRLRGAVRVARLPKIGFLAIDSDPMTTRMEAASGFFGLTITRGAPFKIADDRRIRAYQQNSAHLLLPDSPFDFLGSIIKITPIYSINYCIYWLFYPFPIMLYPDSCLRSRYVKSYSWIGYA